MSERNPWSLHASQTEQAVLTGSDLCLCPGVLSGSGYHGPLTTETLNKYDPYECTYYHHPYVNRA